MSKLKDKKRLVISRHGKAPQKRPEEGVGSHDRLVPEAVYDLYCLGRTMQDFVGDNDVKPGDVFLDHSDKVRTKMTGQALLIGALDLQPTQGRHPPQSMEDLENYTFDGIKMSEDGRLMYTNIKMNEEVMGRDGSAAYFDRWARNPHATEMEGKEITPFSYVLNRAREYLADGLGRLITGNKDLGVAVSHGGGIIEPVAMAAVSATHPDQIGGLFSMNENVQLVLDEKKSGYQASLHRCDDVYEVDLDELMNR
jgi:hypothetical protein